MWYTGIYGVAHLGWVSHWSPLALRLKEDLGGLPPHGLSSGFSTQSRGSEGMVTGTARA